MFNAGGEKQTTAPIVERQTCTCGCGGHEGKCRHVHRRPSVFDQERSFFALVITLICRWQWYASPLLDVFDAFVQRRQPRHDVKDLILRFSLANRFLQRRRCERVLRNKRIRALAGDDHRFC